MYDDGNLRHDRRNVCSGNDSRIVGAVQAASLGSGAATALGHAVGTINGIGTPATSGYQIPIAAFASTPIYFAFVGDSRTAGVGAGSNAEIDITRCFVCSLRSLGIDNVGEPASGRAYFSNPNVYLKTLG